MARWERCRKLEPFWVSFRSTNELPGSTKPPGVVDELRGKSLRCEKLFDVFEVFLEQVAGAFPPTPREFEDENGDILQQAATPENTNQKAIPIGVKNQEKALKALPPLGHAPLLAVGPRLPSRSSEGVCSEKSER